MADAVTNEEEEFKREMSQLANRIASIRASFGTVEDKLKAATQDPDILRSNDIQGEATNLHQKWVLHRKVFTVILYHLNHAY